ncbi:hypothetical protein FACS1894199_07860 [Bacteroidia bacterium]|nr:hypothetical protein FACS1894199_07860 [Bacteroidia bacterium]
MLQKIVLVFVVLIVSSTFLQAQSSKAFYEGMTRGLDYAKKEPTPLPYVNPDDILWSKTLWRELVLREKMNLPYYYPTTPVDGRMSLIDVLLNGIEKSFKTAYEEDELKTPITIEEIKDKFGARSDTLTRLNNETGEREAIVVAGEVHTDEVKRFLIKEFWFFNKREARLESRIVAICPVREYVQDDGSNTIVKRQLFWIDYGEFRDLFTQQRVFINSNDGPQTSYDDLFLMRYFSSRIYKETSVYDNRPISTYAVGIDAILESDRIKNDIFTQEQDLWEY